MNTDAACVCVCFYSLVRQEAREKVLCKSRALCACAGWPLLSAFIQSDHMVWVEVKRFELLKGGKLWWGWQNCGLVLWVSGSVCLSCCIMWPMGKKCESTCPNLVVFPTFFCGLVKLFHKFSYIIRIPGNIFVAVMCHQVVSDLCWASQKDFWSMLDVVLSLPFQVNYRRWVGIWM